MTNLEALRWHLMTSTRIPRQGPPLGGRYSPYRLVERDGQFTVGHVPNRIGLATFVAVLKAMTVAAYSGRIRPHEDIPEGAITADDVQAIEHGEGLPPQYVALLKQIARDEGREAKHAEG